MLLYMPGWIVSPLCSNNHITKPHESAAKAPKYRESGGNGREGEPGGGGGREDGPRGIKDATTREHTYSTIYV